MDEIGAADVKIKDYYEKVYKQLCEVSEGYIDIFSDMKLKLRNNFQKVKDDYSSTVLHIIEQQNRQVGIDTLLMIFTITKIMIRQYKNHNVGELFCTLIGLEMWLVFDQLSSLWVFPSNSHRVKLEDWHVKSLTYKTTKLIRD